MPTIEMLTEHMKKFKDAVIIIGPEALESLELYKPTHEELVENFSKKALKRNPKKFWKFYKEKIYKAPEAMYPSKTYEAADMLYCLGLVSKVITQNTEGLMRDVYSMEDDLIELHGSIQRYRCLNVDCKTKYSQASVIPFLETEEVPTCELCGKPLRPEVLLLNENYDDDIFYRAKKAIMKTHTLIVWGLNYAEEQLVELIGQYGDMKSMENATEDPEKERYLIATHRADLDLDVNELCFHEFLVKDNCDAAALRFIKAIKGAL